MSVSNSAHRQQVAARRKRDIARRLLRSLTRSAGDRRRWSTVRITPTGQPLILIRGGAA